MYPAFAIPDFTIASAISRIILSLTWFRNLFQLFHPMGGVLASPLDLTFSGIGSETGAGAGGSGAGGTPPKVAIPDQKADPTALVKLGRDMLRTQSVPEFEGLRSRAFAVAVADDNQRWRLHLMDEVDG